MILETGKIATKILEEIVMKNPTSLNKGIIQSSAIGEDCAVVDFNNELCLISTDPITGATKDVGYLAVHVNANDIAASGGEPVGIVVTVLLPLGLGKDNLFEIMDGVYKASEELGISVIGGHTEVTDAVNRVVICATIIGKTKDKKFVLSKDAKSGQDLVMTKWAGLEGTHILANHFEEELNGLYGKSFITRAKNLSAYLSVMKESKIAMAHGATAMHDVTEGGVLGAAYELAKAANIGVELSLGKIPILDETIEICDYFGINPYKLISSGAMLIATDNGSELVEKLEAVGINANVIGKFTDGESYYFEYGNKILLPPPESDELYKVL